MKYSILLTSVIMSNICLAQQADTTNIKISDLSPPSSPAFVLLDAAPNSIQKPTTAKAFSSSLINIIEKSGGAIEFTPYWLIKRPVSKPISFSNFFGIREQDAPNNPWFAAKQVSISLAVLNRTGNLSNLNENSLSELAFSNIALGFRSRLLHIRPKGFKDKFSPLYRNITDELKVLNDSIGEASIIFKDSLEKRNAKINELNSKYRKKVSENEKKLSDLLSQQPALSLELAAAGNYFFDSTKVNSGNPGRYGLWMTADWSPRFLRKDSKEFYIHILAVGRFLGNDKVRLESGQIESNNLFDWGGRIEFEKNRFSASVEYVNRVNISNKTLNSDRVAGTLQYRITNQLFAVGTFGNNFSKFNSLITLFGVQLNISDKVLDFTP